MHFFPLETNIWFFCASDFNDDKEDDRPVESEESDAVEDSSLDDEDEGKNTLR